jgi:D-alanyl-lipoteichoic acid acyltransferase DltB (MBOAT superfamily)
LRKLILHVVPEVIKSEFIIGAIGDIGIIGILSLFISKSMNNNSNAEAKEVIKLSHPLGVSFCKIVVHSNHMNTFAFKCV